jgi:UDP-N-acetylglucosamine--dolichyl-phosphate N-acetylglucosaminephosphotransferase
MMLPIQLLYKLILIFLYSFFSVLWILPNIAGRLRKYGYVVEDQYKKDKTKIPSMGGIAILCGILVSLSLSQIFETLSSAQTFVDTPVLGKLFIFYFIVIIYSLYGVLDDLFSPKKRYDKILIILGLSFPIASLISDTSIDLVFMHLSLGVLYSLIVAPIYIMVVANLINLHSGYNGLAMGTSWILLVTIAVKSYLQSGFDNLIFIIPVLGALSGFLPYNLYPSRILEGNTGSFLIGGAIGAYLLVANMEWFGVFILIPHIINFIMDTWTIVINKEKDVKFGKLRADGTIEAPPTMKYKSLKFLVVSHLRLTERQATLLLYGFTMLFCIAGLIIF